MRERRLELDDPRRQVRRQLVDDLDAWYARMDDEGDELADRQDPLDVEPPVDSHWDREREDRMIRQ